MYIMSKYYEDILLILSSHTMKSTRTILKELENKSKKKINWHLVYRVLSKLESKNKIKRTEVPGGIYWLKK